MTANPTACLLVIGNEVLSGRTQDANIKFIATRLGEIGIPLREVRVIPDVAETIIATVNAVRPMFGHTMPTGGLADMNRLVATSGFFGKGDTNLVARFKDLSADEPRSLEEALERGTFICGGPKTVLQQIKRLNQAFKKLKAGPMGKVLLAVGEKT